MRCLLEHGGEPEEFTVSGLIDNDLLIVFVDGRNAYFAANHYVSMAISVADLIDALSRSEFLEFYLLGEEGELVVVEKCEEGNVFESSGFTSHESPRTFGAGMDRIPQIGVR